MRMSASEVKYLCVIPARSGSLGVKNKNTRNLHNYTLVEWSLLHALSSKHINKIAISTNDAIVRQVCQPYVDRNNPNLPTVEILERPAELSTATAMSELALIHAVQQQEKVPEFVVMLQPTSPFRFDGLVDKCIEKLEAEKADSLLTCLKLYNLFWMKHADNSLAEHLGKPKDSIYSWVSTYRPEDRKMKQNMGISDERYFDNGSVYITRTEMLMAGLGRLCGKVTVHPISSLESMQIDSEEELNMFNQVTDGSIGSLVNRWNASYRNRLL